MRSWYVGLLGGLLPILLLGFLYSAIADRLLFVYWALGLATVWVILLRHGFAAGWPGARLAGVMALLGALGWGPSPPSRDGITRSSTWASAPSCPVSIIRSRPVPPRLPWSPRPLGWPGTVALLLPTRRRESST